MSNITLERINPNNIEHNKFIKSMNDYKVKYKYLWDLKKELKENGSGYSYIIKKNEDFIGFMHINYHEDFVTIAYAIYKKYRNQGLGSEVIKSISEDFLEKEGINRINMYIRKENIPSISVALANGFTIVKELENSYCFSKGNSLK